MEPLNIQVNTRFVDKGIEHEHDMDTHSTFLYVLALHQIFTNFNYTLYQLMINQYAILIHRKLQVHSTNIFGLGAKTKITRWKPPLSILDFDSLPYPYSRVRWEFFFFSSSVFFFFFA